MRDKEFDRGRTIPPAEYICVHIYILYILYLYTSYSEYIYIFSSSPAVMAPFPGGELRTARVHALPDSPVCYPAIGSQVRPEDTRGATTDAATAAMVVRGPDDATTTNAATSTAAAATTTTYRGRSAGSCGHHAGTVRLVAVR